MNRTIFVILLAGLMLSNLSLPATAGGADSDLTIVTKGRAGGEILDIVIDGTTVESFELDAAPNFFGNTDWTTHTYTHTGPLAASQVRLEFNNDGRQTGQPSRDIRVDKIIINNTTYETEAPNVTGNGIWTNGACRSGNLQSDTLSCNGHFQYTGGPTPTTTTSAAPTTTTPGNQSPTARAGSDQQLVDSDHNGTEVVALDGFASTDDGSIISFEWLRGQQVIATGAQTNVALGIGNNEIVLRVTDDTGLISEDSVLIVVSEVAASSVLRIKAVGTTGEELIEVKINGEAVQTFQLSAATSAFRSDEPGWKFLTYIHPAPLEPHDVRLEFTNDGRSAAGNDRNVRVDYIEIDGAVFQTEDPNVISKGSWFNGSQCSTGSFRNDNLYCNGYIQYSVRDAFEISEVATNISTPWGLDFLPNGDLLFTERIGRINVIDAETGIQNAVAADMSTLFVSGTAGLLGLAVDPNFSSNRRFYTCQNRQAPEALEIIAWQMNQAGTSSSRIGLPLVSEPSGNGHVGCQIRVDGDGFLWATFGDNFIGTNPQDLGTHLGKVLRINRFTGEGAPGNPFGDSADETTRRIYSFGHRNVQGIAFRPGTDQVYSIGHGSAVDDEINVLVSGGNYGWDPVPEGPIPDPNRPFYDEVNNPMTDLTKFPDAIQAAWSSGDPTVAPGGGDFLTGDQWGEFEGSLAVAMLKDAKLTLFRFDDAGNYVGDTSPTQLDGSFGRLRSATMGPDGALYITTTNSGFGAVDPRLDKILRVIPT